MRTTVELQSKILSWYAATWTYFALAEMFKDVSRPCDLTVPTWVKVSFVVPWNTIQSVTSVAPFQLMYAVPASTYATGGATGVACLVS